MVKNPTEVAEFTLRSEEPLLQSHRSPAQPGPPEAKPPSDPAPWAGLIFIFCFFFLNKLHNTLGSPYKSLCFCFSPGICPGTAEPSPAQAAATSARGNSSGGTDGTDLSLSHRTCPCHTIPALKSRVTQALVAAPHYGPGDKHGGCCLSLSP